MKIKVSILDDHIIVTNGIASILRNSDKIDLKGIYHSGHKLLNEIIRNIPDVLLLDIQLQDIQGDELARTIKELYPDIKILVLTNMNQVFYVRNMFMHGVKGYLLKHTDAHTLVKAIESVHKGYQFIDESMREQMAYELLDTRRVQTSPILTKRELQILELIAEERTNNEIAEELYLSISTIESHRLNLFFKLGVKNAAGLVRKGIQLGLIR